MGWLSAVERLIQPCPSVTQCLWLLSCCKAELSSCDRDLGPSKWKILCVHTHTHRHTHRHISIPLQTIFADTCSHLWMCSSELWCLLAWHTFTLSSLLTESPFYLISIPLTRRPICQCVSKSWAVLVNSVVPVPIASDWITVKWT